MSPCLTSAPSFMSLILQRVMPYHCLKDPAVELPALLDKISQTPARWLLEIGTYKGATAAAVKLAFPDIAITTIDLPDPSTARFNPQGREQTGIAFRQLGLSGIEQLWMDSADLGSLHGKVDFDVIFVDGDHSTEVVYRDLGLSLPLLTTHGIIVVHDYTSVGEPDRPEWTQWVQLAVDAFASEHALVLERMAGWLVALHQPKAEGS